jgi:hypothetical protein
MPRQPPRDEAAVTDVMAGLTAPIGLFGASGVRHGSDVEGVGANVVEIRQFNAHAADPGQNGLGLSRRENDNRGQAGAPFAYGFNAA